MQINIESRLQAAALALAEELNITRAAERLRITQPALSKQIVEFESRLGFPVFIRGQKRIELTDAGQANSFRI
jgi:DNA-binding transcriptional LysR family regulator